MRDFSTFITPTVIAPDTYSVEVPDGWQQGRGAFGGVVVATLVRALEASEDGGRPLRSIQVQICGPLQPGPAQITVDRVRPGGGVSYLGARLEQDGAVQAHAMASLGRNRNTDGSWTTSQPPSVPRWQDVPVLPVQPPFGPVFAVHCEFRPCVGGMPTTGGDRAYSGGYMRFKNPGPARDTALLAAFLDTWWPSAYARFRDLRPMATIAYTAQFLDSWGDLDPDEPLLVVCSSDAAREGYVVEMRELWAPGGRLLALNQQTMAILK